MNDERCAWLQQQVTDRDRFIEIDRSIIKQRDERIERLTQLLARIRPLIAQAISRKEMPSWRYAHYYGGDERTTSDLLHEAQQLAAENAEATAQ